MGVYIRSLQVLHGSGRGTEGTNTANEDERAGGVVRDRNRTTAVAREGSVWVWACGAQPGMTCVREKGKSAVRNVP